MMTNDQGFDFPGDRLNATLLAAAERINKMSPGWQKDQLKATLDLQAANHYRTVNYENLTIEYIRDRDEAAELARHSLISKQRAERAIRMGETYEDVFVQPRKNFLESFRRKR